MPASSPLLVPGIVDAKVVKCGKVSTCASTGTGTQHQLVCWGNKLAVQNMLKANMTWLTPTVIPLLNNKPLKEGTHTFSIGTYTGHAPSSFLRRSLTRILSAGCALVAESSSTSVLWCWGDIRFTVPEQSLSPVPFSTSVMPIPQTAGSDIVAGPKLFLRTFHSPQYRTSTPVSSYSSPQLPWGPTMRALSTTSSAAYIVGAETFFASWVTNHRAQAVSTTPSKPILFDPKNSLDKKSLQSQWATRTRVPSQSAKPCSAGATTGLASLAIYLFVSLSFQLLSWSISMR